MEEIKVLNFVNETRKTKREPAKRKAKARKDMLKIVYSILAGLTFFVFLLFYDAGGFGLISLTIGKIGYLLATRALQCLIFIFIVWAILSGVKEEIKYVIDILTSKEDEEE